MNNITNWPVNDFLIKTGKSSTKDASQTHNE